MTLAEAKTLRAVLDEAIRTAQFQGTDHVDLGSLLSAQLGDVLDDLEAAILAARKS